MLARLSRTASRSLVLSLGVGGADAQETSEADSQLGVEEDILTLELNALHGLSIPIPHIGFRNAVGRCGAAVLPLCRRFENLIVNDIENLVMLNGSPTGNNGQVEIDGYQEPQPAHNLNSEIFLKTETPTASFIPFDDSKLPQIILTPPTPEPTETPTFQRVPIQDSAYGTRLTVPCYSAVNVLHPPMSFNREIPASPFVPLSFSPLAASVVAKKWEYMNGHWAVILPSQDEQFRRGLYSRPRRVRLRTSRQRSRPNPWEKPRTYPSPRTEPCRREP